VPVEISRFYAVSSGSYGPGGLAAAGMHLSRDVHVPVRRFVVEVAGTLPLRAAADPTAAELTTLAVDAAGFLLVPAPVTRPPTVTTVAGNPPPPGAPNPVTRVDGPVAFLGTAGSAFQVQFPAGSPVGPVVMTVRVGDLTTFADLSVTFSLIA
jgi:hypothetical protein